MSGSRATQVIISTVIVVALVAAAAWVGLRDRSDKVVSALLYPELAGLVQTAERVQLVAGGGTVLDLLRNGDRWTVAQRDGYPADVGKIGVLLDNLAGLRILEAKTADPARYADLGVEDVSAAGAGGVRVVISGSGNTTLANLIVGKTSSTPEGTFVRKEGDTASWLVNRLPLTRSPGGWISPLVFHVDTDRIHEATIRVTGKAAFTATKAQRSTEDFVVTGGPLSKPSAANGIAAGLIAIEADDVQRSSALTTPPAVKATYRMFDGLELELAGWVIGNARWITVVPKFNEALARQFADDKPPEDGRTAFWRTPEQARQEAERLGERVDVWAYRIASYRYDDMFPDADQWRR